MMFIQTKYMEKDLKKKIIFPQDCCWYDIFWNIICSDLQSLKYYYIFKCIMINNMRYHMRILINIDLYLKRLFSSHVCSDLFRLYVVYFLRQIIFYVFCLGFFERKFVLKRLEKNNQKKKNILCCQYFLSDCA